MWAFTLQLRCLLIIKVEQHQEDSWVSECGAQGRGLDWRRKCESQDWVTPPSVAREGKGSRTDASGTGR